MAREEAQKGQAQASFQKFPLPPPCHCLPPACMERGRGTEEEKNTMDICAVQRLAFRGQR